MKMKKIMLMRKLKQSPLNLEMIMLQKHILGIGHLLELNKKVHIQQHLMKAHKIESKCEEQLHKLLV